MRTTRQLRDKLDYAMAASGRSLAAEVEYRVEMSFSRQAFNDSLRDIKQALAKFQSGQHDLTVLVLQLGHSSAVNNDQITKLISILLDGPAALSVEQRRAMLDMLKGEQQATQ